MVENKEGYFYGLMPASNEAFPICVDPEEVVIQ